MDMPAPLETTPRRVHPLVAPLMILFVILVGYGLAPTRLPLVGEETRRMQHCVEMAQTGDWVIARNQGVPILDRPPGQYWAFALIHRFIHDLTPMTARVTMVLVLVGVSLATWWYARSMTGEVGSLLAGLIYPTTGHIFDLGRRAEADGLFVVFMASALFVWHHGYVHKKGLLRTWILATLIAALATSIKGLQGPVSFFGAIGLFLLIRRDWRTIFHWSGPVALVLFLGLIAIWQVPLYQQVGWEGTRSSWFAPATQRVDFDLGVLAEHLATFPLKIFAAALPWSPLLVVLASRRFWALTENARSAVLFCICGTLAIVTPVWMIAGGHHRYIIAAYPLMAVIMGVAVERCLAFDFTFWIRRYWRDFARIIAVVFGVAMLGLIAATVVATQNEGKLWQTAAQPWWATAFVAPAIFACALIVIRRAGKEFTKPDLLTPFLLAFIAAMFFNGPVMNATIANAADPGTEIRALKQELPPGTRLVSIGRAFHKFLYWWGEPIELLPAEPTAQDIPEWAEYFVVTVYREEFPSLPFEYERIAFLNMDRTNQEHPKDAVLVGRIIRPAHELGAKSAP